MSLSEVSPRLLGALEGQRRGPPELIASRIDIHIYIYIYIEREIYIYIYIYTHITYIYIYIERERNRSLGVVSDKIAQLSATPYKREILRRRRRRRRRQRRRRRLLLLIIIITIIIRIGDARGRERERQGSSQT